MDLLSRGIEDRVVAALDITPVVILEGPRGAGKTSLCQRLNERGILAEFVNLASESSQRLAEAGPEAFVEGLTQPAGIDEAQLVELTLAVKANVDRLGGTGHFLLTGSSRIGRGALGGTDPLAGRAIRFRLRPFTQSERAGSPVDLVSRLFNGELPRSSWPALDRSDLIRRIRIGGLPVLPGVIGSSPATASDGALDAYVESVIHSGIGKARVDRQALIRTFCYLASLSSHLLNQESTARALGLHPQTLAGYLDTLEALFLIERIPAFHSHARIAARRRPKIHVVDTALAKWAIGLSDGDLAKGNEQLGPLVETLVVGELMAQASMLDDDVSITYWREPKGRAEVDLVLQDRSGRAIPVEIKAGSRISGHFTDGIQVFRREFPDPFHRGIVFYGGDELVELEPNIWAVPIVALWSDPIGPRMISRREPAGTAMFVSYVHDDDRAEGGRIVKLANDIDERYRFIAGDDDLDVFTDHNLSWGDEWQARLAEELRRATLFIPVVTPRFLKSEACRKEVLDFLAVADATGNRRLVCPILYVDPGSLSDDDPVEQAIKEHQWSDWTELRYEDPLSGKYLRAVDKLVKDLVAGLDDASSTPLSSTAQSNYADAGVDADAPDLLDHVENLTSGIGTLETQVNSLAEELSAVSTVLEAAGPELERAGQQGPKYLKAALRRLVGRLEPILAEVGAATAALRETQHQLGKSVQGLVTEVGTSSPWASDIDSAIEAMSSVDIEVDRDSINEIRMMLTAMSRISKDMRTPMKRLDEAIQVLLDVMSLPSAWHAALVAARRRTEPWMQ